MKKHLNVDVIANELREGSAFFPRRREKSTADPAANKTVVLPVPASTSAAVPVPPVRVVPPVPLVRDATAPKRVMKQRHPFDIYQDQYEALQQLALEDEPAPITRRSDD